MPIAALTGAAGSAGTSAGAKAAAINASGNVAGGLFGTLIANAFAKRNAKIQYKNWQKAFDYEAEYNSPKAQLDRLYEANINPLYADGVNNSVSGGMSTGSLPTAGALDFDASGIADAFLRQKELELEERRVKNEEDVAGSVVVKNEQDVVESCERVKSLQKDRDKTDAEIKELDANVAALKARVQMEQDDLYLRVSMFEWQKDYQEKVLEQQKYANVTDRLNAQTNAGNLAFQKSLYGPNGYFMQSLQNQKNLTNVKKDEYELEKKKWDQTFKKNKEDQLIVLIENYERSLSIKGVGLPVYNEQGAKMSAIKTLALAEALCEKINDMDSNDPNFSRYVRLYEQLNKDMGYIIYNQNPNPQNMKVGNKLFPLIQKPAPIGGDVFNSQFIK